MSAVSSKPCQPFHLRCNHTWGAKDPESWCRRCLESMVRILGEQYEYTMGQMTLMEDERIFDINCARDDERDMIADYLSTEADLLEESDEGDAAFNFMAAKTLREKAHEVMNMGHLGNVQPIKTKDLSP